MPEVIDILTMEPANCVHFTANNAVDYVLTVDPGPIHKVINASGAGKFQAGDNFSILSAGYILPESYTLWKDRADLAIGPYPSTQFAYVNILGAVTAATYNIDALGLNTAIFLPLENFEHAIDVFVDTTRQVMAAPPHTALSEAFYLQMFLVPLPISQKAQPAAYNGKDFIITPFMKVLHNLPLL